MGATELDTKTINTIRFLAVDAVEKAKSGHPGAPMGAAAIAYVLWDRFLRFNPRNPEWPDRDRFILSAGHASMLHYALLFLSGYDLPLEQIQQFRQWGSITPGHPEHERTPGVEVTTGPLGQGFANGVGMAIAERLLASRFNRPGHEIIAHYTYALCSDGDLEEGIASEAASLAGTLRLGKLIYFYDDNDISIEGSTANVFTENVGARFQAYGWQVLGPLDGHDVLALDAAIKAARADLTRPSLIICKTIIGYGSPQQGTGQVHGEPLGEEGVRAARQTLGWPQEPTFFVPEEVLAHMRQAVERGQEAEREWHQRFEAYARAHPQLAAELEMQLRGDLPPGWEQPLEGLFPPDAKPIATRSASGEVINALALRLPALVGGSADLAPSTKTIMEGAGHFGADDPCGRNLHFGVREHAMAGICNGLSRHGGAIPYAATFLIFSDYMRAAMRLSALMATRVIYVLTHDSVALGEDGPTHQPVEHLMSLRAMPNMTVIRPADATEVVEAWKAALRNCGGPTVLALTRQNLPVLDRGKYAPAEGLQRGAYVLWESSADAPQMIIIATGSEVHIALEAAQTLTEEGVRVRVVSMPCWELFEAQPREYRDRVLPPQVGARVSIEAGAALGWERYVGAQGAVIGLDHFGASAPYQVLYQQFGLTAARVVEEAKRLL